MLTEGSKPAIFDSIAVNFTAKATWGVGETSDTSPDTVIIRDNPYLSNIDLSKVQRVSGGLEISNNGPLALVNLSNLMEVGNFSVSNVKSLEMPLLSTAGSSDSPSYWIVVNNSFKTFAVENFNSLGSTFIFQENHEVDILNFSDFRVWWGYYSGSKSVTIGNNAALRAIDFPVLLSLAGNVVISGPVSK